MKYRWFPWKWIVGRLARRHGFLDPLTILAQMQRFAKPSEVGEPVELLRAGMVFHARGLLNTRAIQHNLDWVWPYWVERQFDPGDPSFIPRSFSFSHINLTHRNWTAVGVPDCPAMPIVDPRGLVTPAYNGWSCDAWVLAEDGRQLLPCRLLEAEQELVLEPELKVVTRSEADGLRLEAETAVVMENGGPVCRTRYRASGGGGATLVLSFRPYNPEGVSFVYDIVMREDGLGGQINKEESFVFDSAAEECAISDYEYGDVLRRLGRERVARREVHCGVGMATAAASFRIPDDGSREVVLRVPLSVKAEEDLVEPLRPGAVYPGWSEAMEGVASLEVPDRKFQFLFDAAVRTLILHSPGDVFPGPYTYKRFWFRDAAFMVNGLLALGMTGRAERAINRFAKRQTTAGYFLSQEGEWDSNGEALWSYRQFCRLTGGAPRQAWLKPIVSGARWIERKRMKRHGKHGHEGLLPAGFSAEHLGTNDYYYWDNFWGIAGLEAAADLLAGTEKDSYCEEFREAAARYRQTVEESIAGSRTHKETGAIPAAPSRRMDAGAVGSLAVDYPLRLWEPGDTRVLKTAEYLYEKCFVGGGFFQDMIHSGINAYLTIHLAQVFLRAGDPRAFELVEAVVRLASPTGQWPEAIHPRTEGGCMGDGQHAWAAADWVVMVRNIFVREEGECLVLLSGVPEKWLAAGESLRFGPTPTPWGPVTVYTKANEEKVEVTWQGEWRGDAPEIEVRLAGVPARVMAGEAGKVEVERTMA